VKETHAHLHRVQGQGVASSCRGKAEGSGGDTGGDRCPTRRRWTKREDVVAPLWS